MGAETTDKVPGLGGGLAQSRSRGLLVLRREASPTAVESAQG